MTTNRHELLILLRAQEELLTLVCSLQVSVIELFANDLSGTLPSSWSNLSQVQVDIHMTYIPICCACVRLANATRCTCSRSNR